ncbi:MAG: hypothetical protein AAF411_13265 [Myxococcota bacterium]
MTTLRTLVSVLFFSVACGDGEVSDGGMVPGDAGTGVGDGGMRRPDARIIDGGIVDGETLDESAPDSGVRDSGRSDDRVPDAGADGDVGVAAGPTLAFSDLANGPDTGLGDGIGSGAIVTVWGANLGTAREGNAAYYTDSAGVERAAVVYYWKNADGALPGGPADLHSSHRFQELALSIPDSAVGEGTIRVEVDGVRSNGLPFTVREGAIYHVAGSGSDSSGDGSWANPWQTLNHAIDDERPEPGSLLYARDTSDGGRNDGDAVRASHSESSSTADNQIALVSYPNARATLTGRRGLYVFRTTAVVASKLSFFTSSHRLAANDSLGESISGGATFGVSTSDFGRIVGNAFTEMEGSCSSRFQGAIVGSSQLDGAGTGVSGLKLFGNEIFDYGCAGSSALHHTTYVTIRSESDPTVDAWEWGWNYLHNNEATLGIHNWDKDPNNSDERGICGNVNGVVEIHDNVITDQGGAGISVGGSCGWGNDFYIYNNILMNTGLPADWDNRDPSTSTNVQNNGIILTNGMPGSEFYITNNLIYGWNAANIPRRGQSCLIHDANGSVTFSNNICLDTHGMDYVREDNTGPMVGTNNVWFSEVGTTSGVPSWDTGAVTVDPGIARSGAQIAIESDSVLIDASAPLVTVSVLYDTYLQLRDGDADIGPVEVP